MAVNTLVNMAKSWCALRCLKNFVRCPLPIIQQMALPRIKCVCTEASPTPEGNVHHPMKRKHFRRMKAEIYKKNRHDPGMERAARKATLHIPLDTVRQEWIARHGNSRTETLARHYGIFEHIFDGVEFTPNITLVVTYGDSSTIHYGNFLTPTEASCQPNVEFECPKDSQWTILLTNPDGNLIDRNKEFLHWMVGNIPESRIVDGEVVCDYLTPIPAQGTGFHRFVFVLLKQHGKLDFSDYHSIHTRDIASRTFSLAAFLSMYKDQLMPAGLCFFQANWDESVTQTFMETLGMTEPMYKAKEFIPPSRAKKMVVKQVFENKYRNM